MSEKKTECSWCGQAHGEDPNHIWTAIIGGDTICEDCITLSYNVILELREQDIKDNKRIITDPHAVFGGAVESTSGVPTCAVYELYKAGEPVEGLAEIYKMSIAAVKCAIWYEIINLTKEPEEKDYSYIDSGDWAQDLRRVQQEEVFEAAYGAQLLKEGMLDEHV